MPRRVIGFVFTAVFLSACSSESVRGPLEPGVPLFAKSSPTSTDINVTTTIFDADASGNALLMRSDDFNGTGFATYTTSSAHGSSLTSFINTDGGWKLLLANQTTRTVYLVLASQGIAGVPDGNYYASVEAYARCFDASNTRVSILAMASGDSNGNCTVGLDFTAGSTKYKLALGPDYDADSPTGRATVTCTAATNGSCTGWTIAPNSSTATTFALTNGQVVSAPRANLYAYGQRGSLIFRGSYHNSFSIAAAE
jgi:hypothetical protein